jgi:hypothetical protein
MAPFDPANVLIVGAGFSASAGLPLASTFTHALLNKAGLSLDGPSVAQTNFIERFVNTAFGEDRETEADDWPELEDIFTLIDLSANTGHHLGGTYSASDLRVVRRALIVRMIRMLSQRYSQRHRRQDHAWKNLELLLSALDPDDTAVLSMNWDAVMELGVARTQSISRIDYGCGARAVHFVDGRLKPRRLTGSRILRLTKPHGSVNWLYCDACREVFWLPAVQTEKVAQTLFRARDWEIVRRATTLTSTSSVLSPDCPHCGGQALGSRFATFSYRKALDFPMHAASWRTAEEYLKGAARWIFFGYSLPAADFEFKYLLKRVQLSERVRPKIVVITGGAGAKDTIRRFENFFGFVRNERTYHQDGLTIGVLKDLQRFGVLKASVDLPSTSRKRN